MVLLLQLFLSTNPEYLFMTRSVSVSSVPCPHMSHDLVLVLSLWIEISLLLPSQSITCLVLTLFLPQSTVPAVGFV